MSAEALQTTDPQWWQSPSPREVDGPSRRVMLIGLDGATFDILRPMMDQGRMPNLQAFIERGSSGDLLSTIPPITPAAWSTFMTGKGPGRHGILDFERYNVVTNELRFNSSYEIKEKTIWQLLSEKGLRVGAIQVPMTYPPKPVNGFMITGFETPGTDVDFAYPADLRDEVLKKYPDFTFRTKWQRKTFGGLTLFKENLAYIKRSFDQGAGLIELCGERYGWDVLMVMYKLVDNLQHKTWKYLDPKTAHKNPTKAELSAQCFNHLDAVLGKLFAYADSRDADVMIMSDHGHGSLDGKIQPNLLLRQWGYLGVDAAAQQATRTRYILHKWFRKTKGKFAGNYGIEHDLAVNWSQTRAFVAHAGMCGFLYLNLKGRQETGIVDPAEYDSLRDELSERLLAERVTAPDGRHIQLFEAVHRPEELYGCDRDEYPWLPDLMLVPQPGLVVVRKVRSQQPVIWSTYRKLEGTHRMEGVFAAAGPSFKAGQIRHSTLADLAPTLFAALGLKVPQDFEGRVMSEIFQTEPQVQYDGTSSTVNSTAEEVFDEAQQAMLVERLADLGYLE